MSSEKIQVVNTFKYQTENKLNPKKHSGIKTCLQEMQFIENIYTGVKIRFKKTNENILFY